MEKKKNIEIVYIYYTIIQYEYGDREKENTEIVYIYYTIILYEYVE